MSASHLAGTFLGPGNVQVATLPRPVIGRRDILIRILTCGICGSDLNYWRRGTFAAGSVPGHEFAGEVVEVGSEVNGITTGDYVTADPMTHRFGLGDEPGALAEYMRIKDPQIGRSVFNLPRELPPYLASLIEPVAVGMHAVDRSQANSGDRAVILGAGTIGLCILIALQEIGLRDIVVRDLSPLRLRAAAALGARVVDARTEWDTGQPQGMLPTIVFDCAGSADALLHAQLAVANGGRTVIVASYDMSVAIDLHELMLRENAVIGAVGYGDGFSRAIHSVLEKRSAMELLISHHFPLSELVKAFSVQGNPAESLKVMIDVSDRSY